jgi:hypothetical protein
LIKKTLKTLDRIVFFIPRLLIKSVKGLIILLDKKDIMLIIGMSSIFYGLNLVFPPLAFIAIGAISLKLAGLY